MPDEERVTLERLNTDFQLVTVRYGFMESPNIPAALIACKPLGLQYDIMTTSFFLGRKTIVATLRKGIGRLQDRLFIVLSKNAASPTDVFQIPPGRSLEMGRQVSL